MNIRRLNHPALNRVLALNKAERILMNSLLKVHKDSLNHHSLSNTNRSRINLAKVKRQKALAKLLLKSRPSSSSNLRHMCLVSLAPTVRKCLLLFHRSSALKGPPRPVTCHNSPCIKDKRLMEHQFNLIAPTVVVHRWVVTPSSSNT